MKQSVGPEDVFHYIYAVFHSPTYRVRYAGFLQMDFPRVPLTHDLSLFQSLAKKGAELVKLHLLDPSALRSPTTGYTGRGSHEVSSGYPQYEAGTVWINDDQGFEGVPESVWEFKIGGYQVAHKWLKDRRGRALTVADRTHYTKVITALAETIRLMDEIDEAIPSWPIL